jgi:hypothetical protein
VPKIRKVVEECLKNYTGSAKGVSTYVSHVTASGKIESISYSQYSMVISCKQAFLSPEALLMKVKDQMKAVPQGISFLDKDGSDIQDALALPLEEQKKSEEADQTQSYRKFDLLNSKLSSQDFWILHESLKGIKQMSLDETKLHIEFSPKNANADRASNLVDLIHKYFPNSEIREKILNHESWIFTSSESFYNEKSLQICVDVDCTYPENVDSLYKFISSACDLTQCSGKIFKFTYFKGEHKSSYKNISYPKIQIKQLFLPELLKLDLNSDADSSNSESD